MSLSVFLSYSPGEDESALAWRLQILATSHGINLYVPSRGFKGTAQANMRPRLAVQMAIDKSDVVLAILTGKPGTAVQAELNFALSRQKLIIPLVDESIADSSFLRHFPRVFPFRSSDPPGKVEGEVVEYLRRQSVSKEQRQALGALVAIGIGLLLLTSLAEK